VIETYFGAPYIYGPQVVSILENTGGNQAIDNALTGLRRRRASTSTRPRSTRSPTRRRPSPRCSRRDEALLRDGERRGFDDFTLYLMLGARLDPVTALRAADAFAAGSSTAYTIDGGTTCFRAAVTGVNPASDSSSRGCSRLGREDARREG
jgi:hypothetical protein